MLINYYQILDIDKNASYIEIRKRYLVLALKYHPDRNRHLPDKEYLENENKFKLITQAFNTISDPVKRATYDALLEENESTQTPSSTSSFFSSLSYSNLLGVIYNFLNVNKITPSEQTYQNLQDIIINFKKFANEKENQRTTTTETKTPTETETKTDNKVARIVRKSNPSQYKNKNNDTDTNTNTNKDLVYNVNVSLADIYNEVMKELNVSRIRYCNHCLGRGYLGCGSNMSLCHICKGLMKTVDKKVFPIDIREKRLVFEKEGNQSERTKNEMDNLEDTTEDINEKMDDISDLVININSRPHPVFERTDDYDIMMNYDVTFLELYTDFSVRFEHLDGKEYNLQYHNMGPKNTKILISNLGLPIGGSGERGNLYVKLNVILPELSEFDINQLKMMNSFLENKN
jgi:DnaJ-class molecular chaperone